MPLIRTDGIVHDIHRVILATRILGHIALRIINTDTIYDEGIIEKIKEVDLLYHETTYLKDLPERAAARFHSTTVQAAAIAKKAAVKKLLIGHFSSKYESLDEFLKETVEVFENTELALEGVCYPI